MEVKEKKDEGGGVEWKKNEMGKGDKEENIGVKWYAFILVSGRQTVTRHVLWVWLSVCVGVHIFTSLSVCVFAQQAICHSSISVDLQKKTTKDQILVCNTFICSSANKEEEEEDRARGGGGLDGWEGWREGGGGVEISGVVGFMDGGMDGGEERGVEYLGLSKLK